MISAPMPLFLLIEKWVEKIEANPEHRAKGHTPLGLDVICAGVGVHSLDEFVALKAD